MAALSGYLKRGEVLVRKWLQHGENFVGEPIFQVVVPTKVQGSLEDIT